MQFSAIIKTSAIFFPPWSASLCYQFSFLWRGLLSWIPHVKFMRWFAVFGLDCYLCIHTLFRLAFWVGGHLFQKKIKYKNDHDPLTIWIRFQCENVFLFSPKKTYCLIHNIQIKANGLRMLHQTCIKHALVPLLQPMDSDVITIIIFIEILGKEP